MRIGVGRVSRAAPRGGKLLVRIAITVLLAAPAWAQQESATDVNKALTNPVSSLWSITFQQNNYRVDPGPGMHNRWNSNLLFQPVLPVGISDDWNLITRPVVPLFVSTPYPDPIATDPANLERETAFGDIALLQLVSPSPNLAGDWLFGAGPTWIFPSASSKHTGQNKYQVGPAALAGYLSEKWILAALVQNWWSFAGSDSAAAVAQMNLQPVAAYFLPGGWSIGYSGNILANWRNGSGSDWTVPIGLSVSKVVKFGKLPVRIAVGGQWMAVQPKRFGQEWNLQIIIAPVLPKLIRGNLVDPGNMEFGMPH